jgi:signal transduction histidine kinase
MYALNAIVLCVLTQVTHDAAAQQIALTVADTGRGIPDEFRDLIFHTVGCVIIT